MSERHTFRAIIEQGEGGGAWVNIPFDVEKTFGKKRVSVRAVIDGEPYRGSLVRMGSDCHMLIILKEIRAKIGKGAGDEVEVTVEEDTTPRTVEVPADLREALNASPAAAAFFDQLAYTHQREYVMWVEAAKREQTRRDRIERTIGLLNQGKKAR